jgi:nucleotide-binding universal stress UspA family protein
MKTNLAKANHPSAIEPTPLCLRSILVPVDFTATTEKALSYAAAFAKLFGATVTLLHVKEPTYMPASESGVLVELESRADVQKRLADLAERLGGQVSCRSVIKDGSAELEILKVAEETACDLIILSTHGRTGVERLLLGSTAEKVVRRAGCPILVVRPHEHDFIAPLEQKSAPATKPAEAAVEALMKASM